MTHDICNIYDNKLKIYWTYFSKRFSESIYWL